MIKQHFDLIIVALVALSLVMYDWVIDLILNLLHFIFEIIHIAYEWFELGIEHTVEHLFHTSRHGSQIVTFYILLLIAGLLMRWLWRMLPSLYQRFKRYTRLAWACRKTEFKAYWLSLTLFNKVKLLSTVTGIVFLSSLFVM
ncbi:hypothetical protein QZJ86_09440 [Methylomonas montana]|uniref:hypothetical protein n=1 Tax=Methylomonas montana TaxID=3058963 RepID=UPI0026589F77|nr:hypothetical protein [Methylomonas montana]WKJ92346.1 hypothetical protein QZJ86_09440 [Methylomonas montana]